MSRIRILEVLPSLQPAGAEHVVLAIASGLDRTQFETGLISLYNPGAHGLEPVFQERGIRLWHLGKRRGPDPRMLVRLRRVFTEFRPDVIHTHSHVMRYVLPVANCAIAHTLHSIASTESSRFGRLTQRLAFQRGAAPVAVGTAVAESFRKLYKLEPVTIPNGVDIDKFWRPEARAEWRRANGFQDDDLLIVSNGRLAPPKRPDLLAEATQEIPEAQLILAGYGPLRASVEGRERVHVLGYRADIPEILAAADIFALASDWEGLPLAVVEAMAAGLPVVSTDVGSISEVVSNGDTGLLVPAGDRRALTDALRFLVQDPARRRAMGISGRAKAQAFSVKSMVSAYADLFFKLSAERPHRGLRQAAAIGSAPPVV
jgi:glycosyltransferase involved in cell wall biosynthesis